MCIIINNEVKCLQISMNAKREHQTAHRYVITPRVVTNVAAIRATICHQMDENATVSDKASILKTLKNSRGMCLEGRKFLTSLTTTFYLKTRTL